MKLGWRLRRGCTVIALAFFCLLLILPWLTSPKDAVYRAIRVLGPALRRACLPPLRNDSPWGDVNIAIVSLHSVRDELYQISHRNRQRYSQLHGYNLWDGTGWYMHSEGRVTHSLSYYSWIKVKYLCNVMLKETDNQWLFWMDTDALFMNMQINLSRLLVGVAEDDVIVIAADAEGLNAGTFFIRNTELGRQFCQDWLQKRSDFLYEQQALSTMYNDAVTRSGQLCHTPGQADLNHPSGVQACIDKKAPRFHLLRLCAIGPWGGLEWKRGRGYYLDGFYMYGDLLVHFAGNDKATKLELMKVAEVNGL